jgi:hypothetical protein
MDVRFLGKSGHAPDITAMTGFDPGCVKTLEAFVGAQQKNRICDPKETLAALAPEDKADPRVDEVYLSGERQRPV